jgi:glyoxylase-like metal-dependent hydrolase (beta-lactamase superfamily II)
MAIGRYRVTGLRDRDFRLDGGAMFGVVPRVLWERLEPADPADHTIPLATRPLLIEGAPCGPIVVEPGFGSNYNEKAARNYRIGETYTIQRSLTECGVDPADVRLVALTHLHFDHCGAAITTGGNGERAPLFPRATHWVPQVEIDVCLRGDSLRAPSYDPAAARTLQEAGLLEGFSEAERSMAPGITIHRLGGHSDGVCIVTIADAGRVLCFWSDVVPTRHHVHPRTIMAYDLNAEASFAVRKPWIERACAEHWINALYHDPVCGFVQFTHESGKWGYLTIPE